MKKKRGKEIHKKQRSGKFTVIADRAVFDWLFILCVAMILYTKHHDICSVLIKILENSETWVLWRDSLLLLETLYETPSGVHWEWQCWHFYAEEGKDDAGVPRAELEFCIMSFLTSCQPLSWCGVQATQYCFLLLEVSSILVDETRAVFGRRPMKWEWLHHQGFCSCYPP